MPQAGQPFKASPEVELISKKFLNFEDAADLLANAVGCRTILGDSAGDLLRASESLEVQSASLVSFQSIEKIVQSLREEWTTWPKKLRLKRSPFLLVTGRLEINLHPVYLGNLGLGLRGQAGTLLHRWVEELQCIPLGFKELSPAGKHGAVVAASPFVHFYMHFKAVGFAPKKGDWLRGRVCEVQIEAGMNVTLVGLANCHIASTHLPEALRFCKKTNRWLGLDEENGSGDLHQPVVYVRAEEIVVDKYQQSGRLFEINCRLGYPESDMPRVLKEAQAAENEKELKKLERKKTSGQRPAKADTEADEEATDIKETTASLPSKKKKREVADQDGATSSSKTKKEEGADEDTIASPARKKKKPIEDEADEQETTASSTSKKRREPAKDAVPNGDSNIRKEVKSKKHEEAKEPAPSAKQKRGSTEKARGAKTKT